MSPMSPVPAAPLSQECLWRFWRRPVRFGGGPLGAQTCSASEPGRGPVQAVLAAYMVRICHKQKDGGDAGALGLDCDLGGSTTTITSVLLMRSKWRPFHLQCLHHCSVTRRIARTCTQSSQPHQKLDCRPRVSCTKSGT